MSASQGLSVQQRFFLLNIAVLVCFYLAMYRYIPSCTQPLSVELCQQACRTNILSRVQQEQQQQQAIARAQNPTPESQPTEAEKIAARCYDIPPEAFLHDNASFFVARRSVVNGLVPDWLLQPSPCGDTGPYLLVAIPSLDAHSSRRTAIRETWGSPAYGQPWPGHPPLANDTVKVVFFLGLSGKAQLEASLEQEAKLYGDIARANFSDTYGNLSLKMATVLHWSVTNCRAARHVVKVDEDTVVNVPLLLDVLRILQARGAQGFVLGRRHGHPKPLVRRWGRWKVDPDVYPLPYFPKYVYGHSYVISGDAIEALHHASRYMPVVPNEDAYVTGVLAKVANVTRLHSSHFAVAVKPYSRCALVEGMVVSQTFFNKDSDLYYAWDLLKSGNCSRV